MISSAAAASLTFFDWMVVGCYVVGLMVFGILISRRRAAPVDFFLASRASRWPVIGLALFASNISSTALVGLAGGAYATGISIYDYEWSAVIVLVFFCAFLLPVIIRSGTYTMPQFLERRYDVRVRLLFALLTLLLIVLVDSAGILYSGSLVCQLLFPTTPLWLIVFALAGAAAVYAALGGLRSVIYTEAVQSVVLLAGAAVISVGAFRHAGGWHTVMTRVDPAALSLIRPIDDPDVPWPGLLLGIPLLGFYYWCTNQSIVQRLLSAKSVEHARWGALFAGLLKLPVLFLMVLPGTCAILLFPKLPRADMVYPKLILELLPPGLVGLVVASFVAATMVSIGSILNAASTLITLDVIKQFKPRLSSVATVRIGRLTTAAMLFVAVAWTPQLQLFPSLWQYLQAVLAYAVPPVVAVFLGGMYWRGATATGAATTMIVGSMCGLSLFVINVVLRWTHLHFLYAAPLLTALDTVILIVASAYSATAASGARSSSAWNSDAWRTDPLRTAATRPWRDYRYLAAVLLALTAGLVITYR